MLAGKKILVGVTGSIAAYKAVLLIRLLIKAGAEVKVVMTPAAKEFISPLVLATLSKNEVVTDMAEGSQWSNHVMLGRWADVLVIAPLSCNTLAKMAGGLCDNILLAAYLSATCPVVAVPAMDEDMWHHPGTQRNISIVRDFGNQVLSVKTGELASGLFGEGRMAEPEEIFHFIVECFFRSDALAGKKALVTAGPTHEAIDPVRFIGNHSSGKMGFALAEELYLQGADVLLITGPTEQSTPYKGLQVVKVLSALDMFSVVETAFAKTDIAVMAAAVADYRPITVANDKIKKQSDTLQLSLIKTKDILQYLGEQKRPDQYIVGFALETENELENAREKLKKKNADCIILNSLRDKKAGFGLDTNKVTILDKSGVTLFLDTNTKMRIAKDIVSFIVSKVHV